METAGLREQIEGFGALYDYDVSYLKHMLDVSPAAAAKFATLAELAQHREAAPKAAYYAAKIAGALAEDCGPCVQLVADMAREAGVSAASVEAVLTRNVGAMDVDTRVGYRFAQAILNRASEADEAREVVRGQWGEAAVIDLTLGMQVGRVYPMVKASLGFAKTCQRVQVGGQPVDVVKEAA